MGTLGYTATVSLDGFVADASGDFQWSGPSDEAFAVHLERMAEVSTEVLGRKTYELMGYWETSAGDEAWSADEREFARRWRAIDKVVVSSTLTSDELASDRARIVPRLGLADLQRVVEEAAGLVEIFGPTTAAEAITAGMVQEFRFFVVPKMVGAGLRALPADIRVDLSLAEHRVFDNGAAYLRYVPR